MRTPMQRYGHLEELVGAAVFLASESASFITGQILAVDGGYLASGVNQLGAGAGLIGDRTAPRAARLKIEYPNCFSSGVSLCIRV